MARAPLLQTDAGLEARRTEMPLYEYECEQCREKSEEIRRYSDPPYTVCPSCSGTLRKLISSPAIQFKGSGFYINDYKKSGSSDSKTTSGDTSKGTESGSSSESTTASSETNTASTETKAAAPASSETKASP